MKKFVKIAGITIGILLLIIVAVAVALPFIVDPNDYKSEISQVVKQNTGRTLTLKGDIKLSIFPWLGLELGKTRLSNARGFGKKPFVKIDRVGIKVKLLPLLRSQIIVDKIILTGLQLNLARNRKGITNWDDLLQPKTAATKTTPTSPASDGGETGAAVQIGIAGFDVRGGEISWKDAVTRNEYHVRNLDMQASNLALGQSTQLHVGFDAESGSPPIKTRVDLDGDVLFDPDTQRLTIDKLKLQAAGLTLTANIKGTKVIDAPQFSGSIKLANFNARKFLADIGSELNMQDKDALTAVSLGTQFSASTKHVSLKKLKLQMDDSAITGNVSAGFSSAPSYRFNLVLNQIDVDRYLPPVPENETTRGKKSSKQSGAQIVIPINLLRDLNVKGTFKINKMKAFGIKSSTIVIPLNAKGGLLAIGPSKARLYSGKYRGYVQMDVRKGAPRIRINEKLTGVQVGPLLKDAGIFDKFSGKGDVSAKISTRGMDMDDFVKKLNGTAAFRLRNGRIKGLNLHKMVQDAKRSYAKSQGKPVKTKAKVKDEMEFAHSSGTFKIKNGIASNRDLKMTGPYTRVTGKGTANLPRQRVNYRLQVTISDDGKKGGTTVPVRVYGNLIEPTFSIEWQAVFNKAVKKEVQKQVDKEKAKIQKRLQDELRKRMGL